MSHELTIREDGFVEMAYLEGTPIWHGLGNSYKPDASLDEIKKKAGMDWQCEQIPLTYTHDGIEYTITDRVAQVRSDSGRALGIVSSGFENVQPGETFDFFKDIVENLGLTVTTAGTLFGGRKMWVSAYVGEQSVVDDRDRVRSNLLLSTALDGSMATTARYTTTCVVCNNTLTMAMGDAKPMVRVVHSKTFRADEAKKKLGLAPRSLDEFMVNMRKLAARPVTVGEAHDLTNKLMENDKETPISTKIMSLFNGEGLIGVELEGRHGTAWSWLNSVTQFFDHERNNQSDSHRIGSSMWGKADRMKSRALALVTAD